MCRETVDHLHLLGSSGAQFDDTPDQGCPHFPLPLGAKLHDLLLALNQPCIYPYARGRDTTRVIGHATVVEGEPDDFIQIMDEVEGLRELGKQNPFATLIRSLLQVFGHGIDVVLHRTHVSRRYRR